MLGDALRRWSAALVGAVFAFTLVAEAIGTDQCAHHRIPESSGAPHAHHAGAQAPGTGETPDHDGHHGPCTCVGVCHASAGTPWAFGAWQGPLHAPSIRVVARPAAASELVVLRNAYFLPFANAPPQFIAI